jgi:hypothetical protein
MPAIDPKTHQVIKLLELEGAKIIESVSYNDATRILYVKFSDDKGGMCFEDVPKFRYDGLMNAPRPDAYFGTYIRNLFLSKPFAL